VTDGEALGSTTAIEELVIDSDEEENKE